MKENIINVVFASDDNYAQPMGVSLCSMLDNFFSENHSIKITILDGGISDENKNKIRNIGKTFETEINFVKISNDTFTGFPLLQHYSMAIYYRLIIPNLLGEEVSKAIYLDSDTLVLGNIAELYENPIDNYYMGAVKDFISDIHIANALSPLHGKIKKMFNSGVLLLNLRNIRDGDFIKRTLNFIKENSSNLTWPDQEALNIIGADKWREFDKSWNYQVDISQSKIIPRPNILHYTNSYKPWHAFYNNYYQRRYMQYMKKAWPDYKIKPVSFKVAMKQVAKRIPFSISLVRKMKKILN